MSPNGVKNGRGKTEKVRNALQISTLVFSIPKGRKECFFKVRGLKTEKHSGVSIECSKQNCKILMLFIIWSKADIF